MKKPICYNESYTFTVYKDIAVTSVYVEEAEEIQKRKFRFCAMCPMQMEE